MLAFDVGSTQQIDLGLNSRFGNTFVTGWENKSLYT